MTIRAFEGNLGRSGLGCNGLGCSATKGLFGMLLLRGPEQASANRTASSTRHLSQSPKLQLYEHSQVQTANMSAAEFALHKEACVDLLGGYIENVDT